MDAPWFIHFLTNTFYSSLNHKMPVYELHTEASYNSPGDLPGSTVGTLTNRSEFEFY